MVATDDYKTVEFTIPQELNDWLEAESARTGLSVEEYIEKCIELVKLKTELKLN